MTPRRKEMVRVAVDALAGAPDEPEDGFVGELVDEVEVVGEPSADAPAEGSAQAQDGAVSNVLTTVVDRLASVMGETVGSTVRNLGAFAAVVAHASAAVESLSGVAGGVRETIREALAAVPVTDGGRTGRRTWLGDGRAHIEVRGIDEAGQEAMAHQLERVIGRVRGVDWAHVNTILGRVVVGFDPDQASLSDLVEAVREVEQSHQVDNRRFPADRPEHPADAQPLYRQLVSAGVDIAGIGLSAIAPSARPSRRKPVLDAASLLSLVDATPRVRRELESRLGVPRTDLALALANAVAQIAGQNPFGLMVDAAHRIGLIAEVRAKRAVWRDREPQLLDRSRGHVVESVGRDKRVVAMPRGPVERYADGTALAALTAAAATFAATRSHERAITVLSAGAPKAARLSREAFAARLDRSLCRRGVVPMDSQALRRLDRIDSVVIDADVALASGHVVDQLRCLEPDASDERQARLLARASALLDGHRPGTVRRRSGWTLGPLNEVRRGLGTPSARSGAVRAAAHDVASPGSMTLALAHEGQLVAVLSAARELDPMAAAMVGAAKKIGSCTIAGLGAGVAQRLGVEHGVAGGSHLSAAIRAMQEQGQVVALVAYQGAAAFRTADCGIGVLTDTGPVPWSADLLCGPGLTEVCRILDAIVVARTVSRRGGMIASYGCAAGAVLALAGPGRGADRRASIAVNGAAAVGMAAGVLAGRALDQRPDPTVTDETRWHAMDPASALRRTGSARTGLPETEADRRLAERPTMNGHHKLGITAATVDELANPLTPTLLAGAAMSAAGGSPFDAVLIGSVMGANAVLGAAQRVGADRALRRLGKDSTASVRVRRDGSWRIVSADNLVAGDVVTLRAGDPVPADCRILSSASLEVDESGLTGESQLVAKDPAATATTEVAQRSCMLYDGTVVAAGEATGLVVATGPATELGRGSARIDLTDRPGGVQQRLKRLTAVSVPVALGAGVALIGGGLLRGRALSEVLGTGVSLAVAAVPEGLPLVATVGQAAAARRLSRREALVRNPATIETLGRVDVLCFDKTGTLTEGHIHVHRVSDGTHDTPVSELSATTRYVLAAGLRASPDPLDGQNLAHPTDRAVVAAAQTALLTADDDLGGWRVVADVPFESARGYHATVGLTGHGALLCVKGAPEVVLPACGFWRRDGVRVPMDTSSTAAIEAAVDALARQGCRVLAVAERHAEQHTRLDPENLVDLDFLGLLALADPVRPTAANAVAGLRKAGVRVVMVTGDHPSTAESIAAELDILNGGRVLTGPQVDALDDNQLARQLADVSVFARVTPVHKVRIVSALRAAGHTVAMTGDGANDAAAIRLADVGVALGHRGTDAARDAADVVVTDDRLETIIDAIVEGRAMWASVRDAVSVLLGGNIGEILFTVGSGLLGPDASPLNTRQLLLVNLLTDLLPSLALAVHHPDTRSPMRLLHEGPDASLGAALFEDTAIRAASTAASTAGAWLVASRVSPRRAGTVALATLVGTQLGQTVAAGQRSLLVIGASAASAATLAGIISTPGLSHFFGCRPLGPIGWATATTASAAGTAAALIASRVARRRGADRAGNPELSPPISSTGSGAAGEEDAGTDSAGDRPLQHADHGQADQAAVVDQLIARR